MFTELRVAFSLQRAFAQSRRYAGDEHAPAPVTVQEILKAATIDGARCAGLDDRIGSLTPGKQADLIMIRTDDISLFPSNNAVGTVVHAAERQQVDTVMVAGRFRKQGGKLLYPDRWHETDSAIMLGKVRSSGQSGHDPKARIIPFLTTGN
jgi:5-methylthioadenosine/S-adenosylhomocysteine deaminase